MFYDRYNYMLKNHMYTHNSVFMKVGKPINKFGFFSEPRVILPQYFENWLKNKDFLESEFKYLFVRDAEILNTYKNARWWLYAWFAYGMDYSRTPMGEPGPLINEKAYEDKTKNISIIASNKRMCRMHLVRQEFARKCKRENLADTFGRFDGGEYCDIKIPFRHYRYAIAIENFVTPYYWTEKITNCFASYTIPVYLGSSEIVKFFNPDGIIIMKESDFDNLGEFLKQCTPEEYERRLPAVIENYNRLMYYYNGNSNLEMIFKTYIGPAIANT